MGRVCSFLSVCGVCVVYLCVIQAWVCGVSVYGVRGVCVCCECECVYASMSVCGVSECVVCVVSQFVMWWCVCVRSVRDI